MGNSTPRTKRQSGNVFFALFGAVALVGAVGAASMQVLKGPVRSMAEITKRTVAETNMLASTKLAIIGSANQAGADCDSDGFIEPIQPDDPTTNPAPAGGGFLPATIGAALNDPWDTRFAYCAWDHGTTVTKCTGAKPMLQTGGELDNQYAIAVISAGSDRIFQTACNAFVDTTPADDIPDTPLLVKSSGSDDIVLGYTYAEANNIGGGLWTLKDSDTSKATINKDIEVRNAADTETIFGLDRTTGQAEFMAIKTDNIMAKSANTTIEFGDLFTAWQVADMAAPSGSGGGAADNLGNHIATQNLKFFGAAGGAGISGSEVDPQVGTLTNTKWCATDGTDIDCTQNAPVTAEVDPKIGTLTNTKWCTTNGTTISCTSDAPGGGSFDRQTFTSSGTWTKPGSGNMTFIQCWGGGGSGAKHSTYGGGGGGGGGYNERWVPTSTLAATETVTIGAGGAAASVNGSGSSGGTTSFGTLVVATGGGAGAAKAAGNGNGGAGGTGGGSSPIRYFVGGNGNTGAGDSYGCYAGAAPLSSSYHGGGGGGSNCDGTVYAAGPSYLGGAGGAASNTTGTAGTQPGGGGGASRSGNSGAGGAGQCVVTTF